MAEASTVIALISAGADDAEAILAPERSRLTFAGLRTQAQQTVAALNQRGVGRNDRVAIVLPNGAEMATAFVSVACGATTAPLNPAYRLDEFEFYLSDLNAKALIVEQGSESPAVAAAESSAFRCCASSPARRPGPFDSTARPAAKRQRTAGSRSQTTSRWSCTRRAPRRGPRSCRSPTQPVRIGTQYQHHADADRRRRCMNIMPLFHIHGLMAAILASLRVGASVFCTPGFNALKFFAWLDQAKPTWYTAVPTMHQAILRARHAARTSSTRPSCALFGRRRHLCRRR